MPCHTYFSLLITCSASYTVSSCVLCVCMCMCVYFEMVKTNVSCCMRVCVRVVKDSTPNPNGKPHLPFLMSFSHSACVWQVNRNSRQENAQIKTFMHYFYCHPFGRFKRMRKWIYIEVPPNLDRPQGPSQSQADDIIVVLWNYATFK